jgi:hypothetical protein
VKVVFIPQRQDGRRQSLCRGRIQRAATGLQHRLGQRRLAGQQLAHMRGLEGHHMALHPALPAKAMRAQRHHHHQGRTDQPVLLPVEPDLGPATLDQQHLHQGFVPVRPDLPIVQLAALGNGFPVHDVQRPDAAGVGVQQVGRQVQVHGDRPGKQAANVSCFQVETQSPWDNTRSRCSICARPCDIRALRSGPRLPIVWP